MKIVVCDSYDKWFHIKCNFLNKKTYLKLQKDKAPWFCIDCVKNQLPFQSQVNTDPNQKHVSPHKHFMFKELWEHLDLDEDWPASQYYTPSKFSQLDLKNSNLFIHLNISSLSYYIYYDYLNLLLSQMKHNPKITAISETWIRE